MEAVHRIFVFLLCLAGTRSNPVLQQPLSASVSAGGAGTLSCRVENLNVKDYGGFWYRLRSGQRPEWVLTHWASGSIDRATGITERFQPSRDLTTNTYLLSVASVAKADTGAYFCAMYYNNNWHFGNGVHLLIPSRQLTAPTVQLYPPSQEQLARANANVTLSCLVSGFSPGHVRARWTLDGKEAESGQSAGAAQAALQEDGSYSWSSYLTLPIGQWGVHARYACEVRHESSQDPVVHTIERETCEPW